MGAEDYNIIPEISADQKGEEEEEERCRVWLSTEPERS